MTGTVIDFHAICEMEEEEEEREEVGGEWESSGN